MSKKNRNSETKPETQRYYARLKSSWGSPFILSADSTFALTAEVVKKMFQLSYVWARDKDGGIRPDRAPQTWHIEVYHNQILAGDPPIEMHVISDSWSQTLTADEILAKIDLSANEEDSDE